MGEMTRWGIIGAGTISNNFAADLTHCENGKLAGVASRTKQSADAFAATHDCEAFESVEVMLASESIDAVYIGTPNALHAEQSMMAIRAGKAVLCEKPFAVNAEEARAVKACAEEHGIFCMEAMWTRFLPLVQSIKTRVDAGEIGNVQMVRAELGFPFAYEDGSRFADPALGGGALLDLGIYGVSLAHHFLGTPEAVAASASMAKTGVDEHMSALLTYPNAQAVIVASHASDLTNTLVIAGDKGRIEVDAPFIQGQAATTSKFERFVPKSHRTTDNAIKALLKKSGVWPLARSLAKNVLGKNGNRETASYPGHGYHFQARAVGEALSAGRTDNPTMPLSETVAIMETIDRIRADF